MDIIKLSVMEILVDCNMPDDGSMSLDIDPCILLLLCGNDHKLFSDDEVITDKRFNGDNDDEDPRSNG
jgi:hypothetical protein